MAGKSLAGYPDIRQILVTEYPIGYRRSCQIPDIQPDTRFLSGRILGPPMFGLSETQPLFYYCGSGSVFLDSNQYQDTQDPKQGKAKLRSDSQFLFGF